MQVCPVLVRNWIADIHSSVVRLINKRLASTTTRQVGMINGPCFVDKPMQVFYKTVEHELHAPVIMSRNAEAPSTGLTYGVVANVFNLNMFAVMISGRSGSFRRGH